MHLYILPMDAILIDFAPDGRVRLKDEDWSEPSLRERRAILHAAQNEIQGLEELMAALEKRD